MCLFSARSPVSYFIMLSLLQHKMDCKTLEFIFHTKVLFIQQRLPPPAGRGELMKASFEQNIFPISFRQKWSWAGSCILFPAPKYQDVFCAGWGVAWSRLPLVWLVPGSGLHISWWLAMVGDLPGVCCSVQGCALSMPGMASRGLWERDCFRSHSLMRLPLQRSVMLTWPLLPIHEQAGIPGLWQSWDMSILSSSDLRAPSKLSL